MAELRSGDPDFYKNFLRMSVTDFDHLLELISANIRKKDTWITKSITPGKRFAVILRYLATGKLSCLNAFRQMEFLHILFLGDS
nr:unnamed protein product [Callosobruchus analis]